MLHQLSSDVLIIVKDSSLENQLAADAGDRGISNFSWPVDKALSTFEIWEREQFQVFFRGGGNAADRPSTAAKVKSNLSNSKPLLLPWSFHNLQEGQRL